MKDAFYVVVSLAMAIGLGVALLFRESSRRENASRKYQNADPQLRNDMIEKRIRIGMTEEQVIDSWGRPSRRCVNVLKTKTKTTLYCGGSRHASKVYLEGGRVTGWNQPS
jgi:hypothetical protein